MTIAVRSRLSPLMHASSVLVVGASGTRDSATGNQAIRNLRDAGFEGSIDVLHPSGGDIEGVTARTELSGGDRFDTAVVAVAPRAVVPVLEELHAGGVASAIVMSVGLDDAQKQALREFADRTGMPVHGPNCMGVINVADKLMLWADEGILTGLPAGDVGLVSQSGSGAIFVARSMSGVGFSHIISTGNEVALSTADYIDFLADDPATSVIGVIMESIADADALGRALDRAREVGKPVVALKVGRSAAGAQATVAHTGAVLADGSLTDSFFRRFGVPLVDDYDELAASLELLAHLHGRGVGEGRTAMITISGGQAALAADLADTRGVELATFSNSTRTALETILPGLLINNPLDAGGSTYAEEESFAESLEVLGAAPEVDVIVAITDSQATLNSTEIWYEDYLVSDLREAASRHAKLFTIASSSSLSVHPSRVPDAEDDVAVIRGIGNTLRAIAAAVQISQHEPRVDERPADLPAAPLVEELRRRVSESAGAPVPADVTHRVLEAYGIPFVRSATFDSVDQAIAEAEDIGYPLVAKIDSPDIAHKSEVGGVVVGIENAEQLRGAWNDITRSVTRARPYAVWRGIEIQPQIGASIEALVGVVADPKLGAAVVVGSGGVLVELHQDVAHAYAPVGTREADELIRRTRLSRILDGYRNLNPVVQRQSFVDLVVRVSWLAADLRGVIAEFDANPVLIDPRDGSARLIDALLVAAV